MKSPRPSLSDRLREQGRTLAVMVAEDVRNGNRSDARSRMRKASGDVQVLAIARMLDSVDGLGTADIVRFLESFADF